MKLWPEARGFESIPIALLLGTLFGALVFALGVRCLAGVKGAAELQRARGSFDTLVERARAVIAGGEGSVQGVGLDLPGGRITCRGKLVQLWVKGELRRTEIFPLPIFLDGKDNWETGGGNYLLKLGRKPAGGYFLSLEEV